MNDPSGREPGATKEVQNRISSIRIALKAPQLAVRAMMMLEEADRRKV